MMDKEQGYFPASPAVGGWLNSTNEAELMKAFGYQEGQGTNLSGQELQNKIAFAGIMSICCKLHKGPFNAKAIVDVFLDKTKDIF